MDIVLDKNIEFVELVEILRKKVSDAKQFFEGATANVAFKGREITKAEEEALVNVITTETTMRISLIDENTLPEPPEPQKVPKSVPMTQPITPSLINYIESNTAYYHGGLRSGQSIKFSGSVVILGDVNPGSVVTADGNVIVLGALRGVAHAGANGNDECFVSALTLQPTQLRIASIITYVPAPSRIKKEPQKASIAYVRDGQVFIGPL